MNGRVSQKVSEESGPMISASIDPDNVSIADLDRFGHAIFKEWRPKRPFLRRQDGVYLVLRADDVLGLSSDPRTRQIETELMLNRGVNEGAVFDFVRYSMLFSNKETHSRRRSPFTRTFAFRMIENLRPQIRQLTEILFRDLKELGSFNFVGEYASKLPAVTIASLLGLPPSDIPYFTQLVYRVARCLSPSWRDADFPDIEKSAVEFKNYVQAVIDDRRTDPRDDFLSSYINATREAEDLSPVEGLTQLMLIILAGTDTTKTGLTALTGQLLQHRQAWDALLNDGTLVAAAVEEGLRFEPPVGSYPRSTLADIDLDGFILPKNSLLALCTMSALRDEKHYVHPQLFDIHRKQMRWHMVFGTGEHRCLGEALARLELQEGLATVLRHAPNLSIEGEWQAVQGHGGVRRIAEMRVGFNREN
ncbi:MULTISPECIES: cytochrome P450 [Rhizobium/Agrobacterium group]|nr:MULTISPECIES: cytochrome P450 [Rhizobium/Agrobacterium group]MCZ7445580.1 cytochrome P450 [Rhizobium rhizogenes]MCZ7472474.1 cytochrome P450 [Rhizobium rhizogenes]MCZ7483850.1 cytochrome P450 [Rhizobium rhizogenes]MCZ7502325.1 cytochrome P450 [Rhizobium rhizogenes]MCZ7854329.1 cytochrome P450 [Agrobacterium salinitolerans]